MFPFPLLTLTWRESILGFKPTEMVYMQVEHNWDAFNPRGMGVAGNGQAMVRTLGSVKWRMEEGAFNGKPCRKLHAESCELKTLWIRTEDLWVDPQTDKILFERDSQMVEHGTERAESIYYDDHVENHRTGIDGKTVTASMFPEGGMDAVQRRFAPVGDGPKEFLLVDGFSATFRKVRVEPNGHFSGAVGTDKYWGKTYRFLCDGVEEKAMLTDEGELVKVEFNKEVALVLTTATRSRRRLAQPTGSSSRPPSAVPPRNDEAPARQPS